MHCSGPSRSPVDENDVEIAAVESTSIVNDPLLETRFLRQGGMSTVDCIELTVTQAVKVEEREKIAHLGFALLALEGAHIHPL
jgi:hypothetical protein